MKGIYLNDIPVDLFMKYFNETNLAESTNYEPVLQTLTVYTYKFDINGNGPYYYKSTFDFDHVKPEIVNYFQDLEGNFLVTDIVLDPIATISETGSVYINLNIELALPYRYRVFRVSDELEFNFPAIIGIVGGNITSILDSRDLSNILVAGSYESSFNEVTGEFDVSDGSNIVARISENKNLSVYKTDELGRTIFLDEFGNETMSPSFLNSFLRHNGAIRLGFNGLRDLNSHIILNFNSRCLGLVDDGTSKGDNNLFFAYNEKYNRRTTYTKIAQLPTGVDYNLIYFKRDILKLIEDNAGTYEMPLEYEYEIRNVLNFSMTPRIKVFQNGFNNYREFENSGNVVVSATRPVLVDIHRETTSFQGISYNIQYSPNGKFISDWRNLLIEEGSSTFLVLPVINNTVSYRKSSVSTLVTKTMITRNGRNYINIDGKFYLIVNNTIKVPIKINREFMDTVFGRISGISSSGFSMLNYSFPVPTQILPNESSTTYIKDALDSSLIIRVDKEFELSTVPSSYEFNEFIKYAHYNNVGGSITLNNGSKITRVTPEITSTRTLRELKTSFSFSHYIENGYIQSRGPVVPGGLFKETRKEIIKKMAAEFIEKRYDDFLIANSALFDIDLFMKMRIYAESFQSLLENDYESFARAVRTNTALFEVDDVKSIMVISNDPTPIPSEFIVRPENYLDLIELPRKNTFQRIIQYKEFPNNALFEKIYKEKMARQELYKNFDRTEKAIDDYSIIDLEPIVYRPSTDEYKKAIINDLTNNFFAFNNYIDIVRKNTVTTRFVNDEYIKNFNLFYKDKIASLNTSFVISNGVTEKEVYSIDNLDEDEIIRKVIEENWRVL
jgi:hypothetical protein